MENLMTSALCMETSNTDAFTSFSTVGMEVQEEEKHTPRNPFNAVINIIKVLTSHFTSNARSQ